MGRDEIKNRVLGLFETAPRLRNILLASNDVEIIRKEIRLYLYNELMVHYDRNRSPDYHPLIWIAIRQAIATFENILSRRNERMAGFSFLQYIIDILHKQEGTRQEEPSPGFLEEIQHLVWGITGQISIYDDLEVTDLYVSEGREAAEIRSRDLSDMAAWIHAFVERYPWGMDHDVIEMREENRKRILRYFNGSDEDWNDWQWQVRHVIRDADTLKGLVCISDDEEAAIREARLNRFPFGITPYYVSLMDNEPDSIRDRGIRVQVIPSRYYVDSCRRARESGQSMDFMLERDTSPIDGITRRYPMIVILKPINTCPQICVYCQRNWEIEDVCLPSEAATSKDVLDRAIQWIDETEEIREVLITGGDPFLLPDGKIESILSELSRISHVERIRIGTRTPVTLPQRITNELVQSISGYHRPGIREIVIVTHCEHSYEITPQMMEAVQKFRHSGISVYNQLVYTFYNSRRYEASFLRHKLRLIGVTPYYTFNTKGKEETNEYRVPLARLLQEQSEGARLFPGMVRTDEVVFNVPRLGKNYLRAAQHRDLISILPDGRRVYEFHPWEKNIKLVETYIHTDVSIYDYLERMKAEGEDMELYKTIWYYY
ncbi:MAG: KamA family radical SAM protein [Syntrophales bacterium]|nr:KamA family radical SAM protein [Syntrophales bacterium]